MQAALDVAEQGVKAYFVEKEPSIGGHVAMLDKTFPTLDCYSCILNLEIGETISPHCTCSLHCADSSSTLIPKMLEVSRHRNVELLSYAEVQEVERIRGGFKVRIIKKSRFVDEAKCTGCGVCVEECPIDVPNEFDLGLSNRKAIYIPFSHAVPFTYTIDDEHCTRCGSCEKVCKEDAIDFDRKPEFMDVEVGAIIVATGFEVFNARKKAEYGYGRYPNVITSLELERMLNASGPTSGHVTRASDKRIPRRIAFIQCVGSRDRLIGNPYCSKVCCMGAIKNGVSLREHIPDSNVTMFYIDVRTYGRGFEELHQLAKEEFGIHWVRGRVARVGEDPKTNNLTVLVENTETGESMKEEFDLVVLSVGFTAPKGNPGLSKILNVPLDEYGFFRGADIKIDPVGTGVKEVFIAGAARGPMDIPESVADASAAAMRAVTLLRERR